MDFTPTDIDTLRYWGNILNTIKKVDSTAILAGGALRDLDNNRPVKDLDIFLFSKSLSEARIKVDKLKLAGINIKADVSDTIAYPEDQNLEVILIAEATNWDSLPVQLIFTNWDTTCIIDRFDYGICQISYNGTILSKSIHYLEDQEDEVFRLRRDRPTPASMRGSIHRYARLVQKYEGWTWGPYEDTSLFFEAM